jgi:hypothetical protein
MGVVSKCEVIPQMFMGTSLMGVFQVVEKRSM